MAETRKIVTVSAVVLVLLLLGSFLLTNGFGLLNVFGTSTLSIDRADLKSSIPQLNGEVWQLTFRAGGLSQRYFGSFSPSEVQDANLGGESPEDSFSIEVEYKDQSCNYDISATGSSTPIYDDIQMETWRCFFRPSLSDAQSRVSGDILAFGVDGLAGGVFSEGCFAVYSPTRSPVGRLESPDVKSEFTISLNAGGESASRTFNTLSGSTQGTIGNFAYAIWQGNLVSGKSCKDKDPFIPIYVNGVWRIGSNRAYLDYREKIRDGFDSTFNDRPARLRLIEEMRRLASNAKLSKSFGSFNSRTSLTSASVESVIQDPVQFPVTTLYIEADTLGIFTPAPRARLFSPSSNCFETGDQGSIEVGIENTGDDFGTWNLFAECESPFRISRNIQVSLAPGQSDVRLIPITASADREVTSRCIVVAENPAGQEKISVGVCVKPQITCEAGASFCSTDGDTEVIKTCSSSGATSSIVKRCSSQEFCEDEQCKRGEKNLRDSGFFGFFKNLGRDIAQFWNDLWAGIFGIFFAVKLLIIFIGSIFTLFLSKGILNDFDELEDREAIKWIISAVITALVAWILFLFIGSFIFWILLIAGGFVLTFFNKIKGLIGR